MRKLLICLCVILVSGCSPSQTESTAETKPDVGTVNPKETVTCPADGAPYKGLKCGDVRLGISLAAFKKLADENHWVLSEESTKYPSILKKFLVALPPPVASISWTSTAKFVDDGTAFRLYEIEGRLSERDASAARKLSSKLGKSRVEGMAHKWVKGGTKARLIDDGTSQLLSLTHDQLIDVSGSKMADAIDRGDYVH